MHNWCSSWKRLFNLYSFSLTNCLTWLISDWIELDFYHFFVLVGMLLILFFNCSQKIKFLLSLSLRPFPWLLDWFHEERLLFINHLLLNYISNLIICNSFLSQNVQGSIDNIISLELPLQRRPIIFSSFF